MDRNKKHGGRVKKEGWEGYGGTITGEVLEAIHLIAAHPKRDSGAVVDEFLRKGGIVEFSEALIQKRYAKQVAKAQRRESEGLLKANPEYHRIFAECVFEELERTNRLCSFEAALRIRGYFPEFGEVDGWRHLKEIPFEYHQAIHLYLGCTGWDARLDSFLRSMPPTLQRGISPLATGMTDSPMF